MINFRTKLAPLQKVSEIHCIAMYVYERFIQTYASYMTYRHTYIHPSIHTYIDRYKHTSMQTDTQAGRQTDRQAMC